MHPTRAGFRGPIRRTGLRTAAIASLADLLAFLESGGAEAQAPYQPQVQAYRERDGV